MSWAATTLVQRWEARVAQGASPAVEAIRQYLGHGHGGMDYTAGIVRALEYVYLGRTMRRMGWSGQLPY